MTFSWTKPKPIEILETIYNKALVEFEKDKGNSFIENLSTNAQLWIYEIGGSPERHKATVAVLATLLTKKIETPSQDIRYHRTDLERGFSGRSYDTLYITPFIKEKFGTKFAMKESGWLTRSFEKPEPFLLNYTGKITPTSLKYAFLHILDDVEKGGAKLAEQYLVALFIYLLRRKREIEALIAETTIISPKKEVTINQITQCLEEHFLSQLASRLPVIAIYSAYKVLMEEVRRYKGKRLNPLRAHVSPDLYAGLGDIEVVDEKGEYFEVVEVKYGKPIDVGLIEDIYGKIKNRRVKRYCLLTTAEPYVKTGDEISIKSWIEKIRKECGCEVIINGVIPTIRYYLRLMENPSKFISVYAASLQEEFKLRFAITEEHVKDWFRKMEKLLGR
ncbi:MAG: hypothetical protein QXT26_02445 [Thermoproteota archaeon]